MKLQNVHLCFYPLKPYRTAIVFFRILADANVLHITCAPLNALIYWHEANALRLYASLSFCNGTNCVPIATAVVAVTFRVHVVIGEVEVVSTPSESGEERRRPVATIPTGTFTIVPRSGKKDAATIRTCYPITVYAVMARFPFPNTFVT